MTAIKLPALLVLCSFALTVLGSSFNFFPNQSTAGLRNRKHGKSGAVKSTEVVAIPTENDDNSPNSVIAIEEEHVPDAPADDSNFPQESSATMRGSIASFFTRQRASSTESAFPSTGRWSSFVKGVFSVNPLSIIEDLEREQEQQARDAREDAQLDSRLEALMQYTAKSHHELTIPAPPVLSHGKLSSSDFLSEVSSCASADSPLSRNNDHLKGDSASAKESDYLQIFEETLEDEFVEIESSVLDPTVREIEDDFIIVSMNHVPKAINNIVRNRDNFDLLMQVADQSGTSKTFINTMRTVLIQMVKQIFFNEPPKSPNYAVLAVGEIVPPPRVAPLSDVELAELLLLPPSSAKNRNLLGIRSSLTGTAKLRLVSDSALPRLTAFAASKNQLATFHARTLDQIKVDLPRLAKRYYLMYRDLRPYRLSQLALEEENAVTKRLRKLPPQEQLSLNARTGYVLYYLLNARLGLPEDAYYTTFLMPEESSEAEDEEEAEFGGYQLTSDPRTSARYTYTQGMDQIAAYFAIKYDLRLAGPMALRFFERHMMDILTITDDSMNDVYRGIEEVALNAIHAYLESTGELTPHTAMILDILRQERFSCATASVLHFAAAPSFTELDQMVQFLLIELPPSQGHRANSLLLAARVLYSMPTFLGGLKRSLEVELPTVPKSRYNDLVSRLSGYLFIEVMKEFGSMAVFPREEMDVLLEWARKLLPFIFEA